MSDGLEQNPVMSAEGWFTTLGDLLTLLLCFFLAAVSFSTFSPPEHATKTGTNSSHSEEIAGSGSKNGQREGSGTSIAPQVVGEIEIGFAADDISSDGTALSESGLAKLEQIKGVARDAERVELVTCAPDETERGDSVTWHRSIERALLMKSSLKGVGISGSALRVDVRGVRCGGKLTQLVSTVTITRTVTSNG